MTVCSWQLTIYTNLTTIFITTCTFRITRFTISKLSSITSKCAIIIISCKENALCTSTSETHWSYLGTRFSWITWRTKTFSIKTNSISITLLGTSFHCTSSRKGKRTHQVSTITWYRYVLTWKHAKSISVAYFNCESFPWGTANCSITPKCIFSRGISL